MTRAIGDTNSGDLLTFRHSGSFSHLALGSRGASTILRILVAPFAVIFLQEFAGWRLLYQGGSLPNCEKEQSAAMTDTDIDDLERVLDERWQALQQQVEQQADDAAIAASWAKVDLAILRIENLPLKSLGDVRRLAKALRCYHDGDFELDSLGELLTALENLPSRLWAERLDQPARFLGP